MILAYIFAGLGAGVVTGLAGAISHVSMGAHMDPVSAAVTILCCLFGAWFSAKFANRCEIVKLNKVVGVVLSILGVVTILMKLL